MRLTQEEIRDATPSVFIDPALEMDRVVSLAMDSRTNSALHKTVYKAVEMQTLSRGSAVYVAVYYTVLDAIIHHTPEVK